MAISLDGTSRNVAAASATNSYSHTIGSGSDRILFFELVWVDTTVAAIQVAYETYVDGSGLGWAIGNALYYYVAPAVGSVTIAGTLSGAVAAFVFSGESFFGAKQTSPINAFTSSKTNGVATYTIGVTPSVANCWAIASIENHFQTQTATSGCVFRVGSGGGDGLFDSNGTITNGALHNFVVDVPNPGYWSGVMCAFEEAGGGGGGNPWSTYNQMRQQAI